ncbi:MAG: hypothetical protein ACJA09_003025 [Alcanivorax sp.]|jgi:hypothetical protein
MSSANRVIDVPQIGRRQLLARLGAGLCMAGIPGFALSAAAPANELWVSARGDSPESFGLGWVDSANRNGREIFTGFRGHGVLQHALHQISMIFISRRPGTRALELNLATGEVVGEFRCKPGNHLFGHGCFSHDGRVLFTTEANAKADTGQIVVRDAENYKVLEEWSSHGVGPHDMRLLPGGKTLVVANGGILTRTESGRRPLNLATMNSSLSYIDATTGVLIDDYRVAEAKSSIRHLDVALDGTVAFAIQLQREAAAHNLTVPLAGVHRAGEGITLFDTPGPVVDRLRDYVGSVAICEASRVAGFTSPKGSLAVFWNIDSGEFAGYHRFRDVSGIAVRPTHNAFLLSNSFGELRELNAITLQERREKRVSFPGFRFDNHLTITRNG